MRAPTIYNGSAKCQGCPTVLTPLEVMYSGLCPSCTAELVRQLREQRIGN